MPTGTEFIKHEFNEAIAIQQTICECGESLSKSHSVEEVRQQLKADLKLDRSHLQQLEKFGRPFGADGELEEVAQALSALAQETAESAEDEGEESEAYEAHAVLLNLKRKQQDSTDAVVKIARDRDERELVDAASEMKKEIKQSADQLAKSLADFAVRIAAA